MTRGRAPADEVRVWRADVPTDPAQLRALSLALTDAERAWAERLREGGPGARFVAGRAALRRILAASLGCAPLEVPLRAGPGGKPVLAEGGDPPLHFSVSHSGAVVLVATAREPVGIDVEAPRRLADPAAIAGRFFAPAERAFVEAATAEERVRRFLVVWTAKEAVLKASGVGLPGLPEVEVSTGPGGAISASGPGGARWDVRTFEPAPGRVAALAAPTLPARIRVQRVG